MPPKSAAPAPALSQTVLPQEDGDDENKNRVELGPVLERYMSRNKTSSTKGQGTSVSAQKAIASVDKCSEEEHTGITDDEAEEEDDDKYECFSRG